MKIEADDQKWWQSNYQILCLALITFENILSIRVLEWLVILVGCKVKGINELEARKSRN